MDLVVACLVIASALLHPLREVLIKGHTHPEALAYAVMILFGVFATVQLIVTGTDPWAALQVWPLILLSGTSVVLFYLFTVMTLKHGDVSIYYPITRSSPLFVVTVGFFVLGQRYSPMLLAGIAIVLAAAFLLQYERGVRLFDHPKALVLATLAMSAHGLLTLADAEAMKSVTPMQFFFVLYLFVLPVMGLVFIVTRPRGRPVVEYLFGGWRSTPWRFLAAGVSAYASYYLLLTAFHLGGNVAAVASLRQISIPVSVILGGMVLRERKIGNRLIWSAVLGIGVALILVSR